MKRTLIYATNAYPGDVLSERVFAVNDLVALGFCFERIIVVPTDYEGEKSGYADNMPPRSSVDWEMTRNKTIHSKWRRLPYLFHPFVMRALWGMRGEAHGWRQWAKGFYQAANTVAMARILRRIARRHGVTPAEGMMMSLWMHDAASAMAYLGLKDGWRVVTRAHSADIYDHLMLFRSRRMRDRLLGGIERVFAISRSGADYLRGRFPRHAAKIETHMLGSFRTYDPPSIEIEGVGEGEAQVSLRLLTVARLHPVKRLPLAARLVCAIARQAAPRRVRWTLVGEGSEAEKILGTVKACGSGNLEFVWRPGMENGHVQRMMAEGGFDWFLLTSESEGVPVSIGEAMSYGIPPVATDVGEIHELVTPAHHTARECTGPAEATPSAQTDPCGILIPKDFDCEAEARRLLPLLADPTLHRTCASASLRRWHSTFDSARLTLALAQTLPHAP